jgi:outer membrane usher protein
MSPSLNRAALAFTIAFGLLATLATRNIRAQDLLTDRDLELDVVVNGHPIGQLGEFRDRDGKLSATRTELDSLGFRLPPADLAKSPTAEIPLASLPGISYRVDERTQTVLILATDQALKPVLLQPGSGTNLDDIPVRSGLGADLNYEMVGTFSNGQSNAEALLDGHVFSPWGLLSASGIAAAGAASGLPPFVRLDSTYSYTDVATMREYAAGDFINGGLDWSRPIRMGGIQIASDFSVRPDLVTFPVPTIAGQVAVPSSVDVLVNGVQLLSQNVPSGPFQINQLPVVTGTGDVSVITRNSAGQQTTETLPFYSSTLLLKPGLSSYSAEAGAVRLNYGLESDDYQAPAASLTYRYGMSDWLTVEGHAEGTSGSEEMGGYSAGSGAMGGGGGAFTIGHFGVASLDAAFSEFGGRHGGLLAASFQRMSPLWSVSGSVQVASKDFADVAAAYGQPMPTFLGRASVGLTLPHLGSLGLAFVEVQQPTTNAVNDDPYATTPTVGSSFSLSPVSLVPEPHVSLLSASYSRSVLDGRAFAYATAFDDLSSANSAGVMLGLTIPFGDRGSVSAGIGGGDNSSDETLQATEAANTVGDFGYQVLQGAGGQSQQLVSGSYKSPWGLINAAANRIDGQTAYRGEVQGSLALADDNLFAANTITDSFAVVDTDQTKGIEVLQENRPIGKTGPSGLMLVPDLVSFDVNHLGIDPNDVPLDAQMGTTTQWVRPQNHSGVVVHFPIHLSHGALLRLVDGKGRFIPVGSSGHLVFPSLGQELAIGYDGEAFVTGLGPRNRFLVTLPDGGQCAASFSYKPKTGFLPQIGPIPCREITQ